MQRAKRRTGNKTPEVFQWDLYFLRVQSHTHVGKRNTVSATSQRDGNTFDTLVSNITDKKVFNRKGQCMVKTEKGDKFRDVTLILAGDYLYIYVLDNSITD